MATPHTAVYYAQVHRQAPQPEYTCPTCREPVKNRPVEDFALKELIRAVSAAGGENSPKKKEMPTGGKMMKLNKGPLDGFFPEAI